MSILKNPVVLCELSEPEQSIADGIAHLSIDPDGILHISVAGTKISCRQGEFQQAMHRAYVASQNAQ